jgi:hypothetical protein
VFSFFKHAKSFKKPQEKKRFREGINDVVDYVIMKPEYTINTYYFVGAAKPCKINKWPVSMLYMIKLKNGKYPRNKDT